MTKEIARITKESAGLAKKTLENRDKIESFGCAVHFGKTSIFGKKIAGTIWKVRERPKKMREPLKTRVQCGREIISVFVLRFSLLVCSLHTR
jgi:hypothetical protein